MQGETHRGFEGHKRYRQESVEGEVEVEGGAPSQGGWSLKLSEGVAGWVGSWVEPDPVRSNMGNDMAHDEQHGRCTGSELDILIHARRHW